MVYDGHGRIAQQARALAYDRSMRNTSDVGNRTEGIILSALMRAGKKVLLPFGGGHRYDLAIDEEGTLKRIQCKTARYMKGCITFPAHSSGRDGRAHHYYGDADLFGVYAPCIDKIYLVPVNEVSYTVVYLRVDPPKNNQVLHIRWAREYELKGD